MGIVIPFPNKPCWVDALALFVFGEEPCAISVDDQTADDFWGHA